MAYKAMLDIIVSWGYNVYDSSLERYKITDDEWKKYYKNDEYFFDADDWMRLWENNNDEALWENYMLIKPPSCESIEKNLETLGHFIYDINCQTFVIKFPSL
jgi:hypothetical protein